MSQDNRLSQPVEAPQAEVEEAKRVANLYHPVYGLQRCIFLSGTQYDYDRYLDAWVSLTGHALDGNTIHQAVSSGHLRLEVK